jgi:hypothetical protein
LSGAADGRRPLLIVFAIAVATLVALLAVHRDMALYLGNTEWDYVGQVYNHGEGTIQRSSSLRDALRPDGLYGQGYAVATWAVRASRRALGLEDDCFRAAQLVTAACSLAFLAGAWRLGRALGLRADLEWLPPAALGCAWPFTSLAAQVTTDVPAAAIAALAMPPLLEAPSVRGGLKAGILLGLATVVRGNILAVLPIFLVAALVAPAEPAPLGARLRFALAIAGGFVLGAMPRLIADYVQTGLLFYHEQAKVLRAVLHEGGLERFRDEPARVLEIIGRDPALFARSYLRSYAYYAVGLLTLLAAPLVVLLRDPRARRRAVVGLILVLGIPLGASTNPAHAPRYIMPLFPVAIALLAAGIDRALPEPRRPAVRRALAIALAAVFALDAALLLDKYRADVPEAEIRAALDAAGSRSAPVLVRLGVATDQGIYLDALRFRLRRLDAPLALAPAPLDPAEVRRLGLAPPLFVLRVPIRTTGPSILRPVLAGRGRPVLEPAADPLLTAASPPIVRDAGSGIELHLVPVVR